MSKILSGKRIQLQRGFADGECRETAEKFMSIETEREQLLLKREKAFEQMARNRGIKSGPQKNAFDCAKSQYESANKRLREINERVEKCANLSALILNRVREFLAPADWEQLVKIAKIDQKQFLQQVSAWEE